MAFKARRGREGSRWINERPTPEQVAKWFTEAVQLPADMDHQKYVGGITLIPANEKSNQVVGYDEQAGFPQVREVTDLTWTPYMKVETRVAFFWDFVNQLGGGETGHIEPDRSIQTEGLPAGFFRYSAAGPDNKPVAFIGATYRVRITSDPHYVVGAFGKRELEAVPFLEATGTKIVPVSTKYRVDENAVMKAETGAIGRALGVAGMLVLPGSGIATAEDMQEALAASASPTAAALPADAPVDTGDTHATDDELRERAEGLLREFERFPEDLKLFRSWAKGRGTLASMTSPALKGFVRKLERDLDTARHRDAETQVHDVAAQP